MINKLKCRLAITLFLCVVTATAAFGGWAAVKAYRSLRALVGGSAKAEKALAERYSQLGQQMDSQLRDIHSTLLQLIAEQDPATAVQFDKRCEQFRNWLSTLSSSKIISGAPLGFEYDPSAVATQAIPIFNQYEQHAKNAVRAALTTTDATGKNAVWRSLTTADENLHHLVHLAASLRARADAHLAARRVAAAPPSRELLMATALLLLALMCGWIAVTVYRTELLPLRRKLQAREILLQQQEQLAQFGKLAAGLAHEIRNPLTAINTRLFLLQRALPTDSPAHQDAHVIRGEIERLDRVVSDFLRLARPPEPRYQALSAEEAFRDVVDLLRPTLTQQAIGIDIGTVAPNRFEADPEQLKQVLINLIQNAAESFTNGGRITLSARRVQRNRNGVPSDFIALEVQDNGPGISPAVQQRLFEPFFSTKRGGSGLGLSISAHIVQRHGGTIEFQTAAGVGTTFTVLLPLQPELAS